MDNLTKLNIVQFYKFKQEITNKQEIYSKLNQPEILHQMRFWLDKELYLAFLKSIAFSLSGSLVFLILTRQFGYRFKIYLTASGWEKVEQYTSKMPVFLFGLSVYDVRINLNKYVMLDEPVAFVFWLHLLEFKGAFNEENVKAFAKMSNFEGGDYWKKIMYWSALSELGWDEGELVKEKNRVRRVTYV